ncbi:MAG: AbrB/MazE/SpoVT family DNA-binding domain-containing protein [Candidatus Eisenbacteria bacterium]|nr:AbrB/MazE/SpoVT family DNA-binding domain-containing protein [Candidatus Eisenbacteria bacterium]MCC7144618.1 AbrB/MazE/SpoVT family DNA-binding domain-containing protein [Candidatus Eisenbacteria bacterium]
MKPSFKMRIGERGQVVIPKELRERFGLLPNTDVEFLEEKGRLLVRPLQPEEPSRDDVWGKVWGVLRRKVTDVDRDIEEMRGR